MITEKNVGDEGALDDPSIATEGKQDVAGVDASVHGDGIGIEDDALDQDEGFVDDSLSDDYDDSELSDSAEDELIRAYDLDEKIEEVEALGLPAKQERAVEQRLSEAVVTWEISELVNEHGEFNSRKHFRKHTPHLFIEKEDQIAGMTLSPQVTRHLKDALTALDNIYRDEPPIPVKKTFTDRLFRGIDWWFAHKIKGTLVLLLSGFTLYSAVTGIYLMLFK